MAKPATRGGALHCRYPSRALAGDYARAGAGVAVTGGPLLFVPGNPVTLVILGGLAGLFALFGLRTLWRHATTYRVDATGIVADTRLGARRIACLPWQGIERVKLSYFSTRRDRENGWMQMVVRGADAKITMDSALENFHAVAEQVALAMAANRIGADHVTASNFLALGIDPPPTRESLAADAADEGEPRR